MNLEQLEGQNSDPVMHAANAAGNAAWCFLPIDCATISRSSATFRQMWGLTLLPGESEILLSDPRLEQSFRSRGLEPDWLLQLTLLSSEAVSFESKRTRHQKTSGLAVFSEILFDENGRPIGRLVTFDKSLEFSVPQSTLERLKSAKSRLSVLSNRETQILELVYEGLTNKAIGVKANISEKTVEKHRSNIMHKLGLPNATRLIRCVTEAKFISDLQMEVG